MGAPYGYYLASNGHVAIDREKANVLRCSSWAHAIFRLRPAFLRHKIAAGQNAEASQFCIE